MPAITPVFNVNHSTHTMSSVGHFHHHHQHSMQTFPSQAGSPAEQPVASRKRKCAHDEDEATDMHMDDMMLLSPSHQNSPVATSPTYTHHHVAKRQFGVAAKRVMYSGGDATSAVLQALAQQQAGDTIVECPRAESHPAASMLASPWCMPVYNTVASPVKRSCDADGMDIDVPVSPKNAVVARVTGICGV